jgi:hypothetical protein
MRKFFRVVGYLYLTCAVSIILGSYAWIWWHYGLAKLIEIASPFNLINTGAVLLTIAPGFLLLHFTKSS